MSIEIVRKAVRAYVDQEQDLDLLIQALGVLMGPESEEQSVAQPRGGAWTPERTAQMLATRAANRAKKEEEELAWKYENSASKKRSQDD